MKWCFPLASLGFLVAAFPVQDSYNSVKDFKSWKRLTANPVHIPDNVSWLCVGAQPHEYANPHRSDGPRNWSSWIHVYVNPKAERAIASKNKTIDFPEGSILVKTKFPEPGGSKIELMTVMIKGPKRSHPKTKDWQFLVMNGNATSIVEDKRIDHCWTCHKGQAATGYAFLDYKDKK